MPAVKQRGTILSVAVDEEVYKVGSRITQGEMHHRIHHILERMDPNGTACWAVYVELYRGDKPMMLVGLWKDIRGNEVIVEYELEGQ